MCARVYTADSNGLYPSPCQDGDHPAVTLLGESWESAVTRLAVLKLMAFAPELSSVPFCALC